MAASDPQPEAPEPDVVHAVLDQPVAQVIRFFHQALGAWFAGLLDPWRLGRAAAAGSKRLAPPFALVVVAFFSAGVGMRMWRAMALVPLSDDASLAEDFRAALGDVSLAQVILVTMPCVLIVAGGARIVSFLFGGRDPFGKDRVVAAACYAAAWQAGVVLAIAALFIAMQMAGYEPSGSLNDEVNDIAPYVAGAVMLWGALILAPALRDRLPERGWWPTPVALAASLALVSSTLLLSMGALSSSINLASAARLRADRHLDHWIGDLQVKVLETKPLGADPAAAGERFELTVAYSNRAERMLIVPLQRSWEPPEGSHRRFDGSVLRVLSSSLSELPDRALLIDPGATRVATYVVEQRGTLKDSPAEPPHATPYAVSFHRRDAGGYFEQAESILWGPNGARYAARVGERAVSDLR